MSSAQWQINAKPSLFHKFLEEADWGGAGTRVCGCETLAPRPARSPVDPLSEGPFARPPLAQPPPRGAQEKRSGGGRTECGLSRGPDLRRSSQPGSAPRGYGTPPDPATSGPWTPRWDFHGKKRTSARLNLIYDERALSLGGAASFPPPPPPICGGWTGFFSAEALGSAARPPTPNDRRQRSPQAPGPAAAPGLRGGLPGCAPQPGLRAPPAPGTALWPPVPRPGYWRAFRRRMRAPGPYRPGTGIQKLSPTGLGWACRAGPSSRISVGSGGNIEPSPFPMEIILFAQVGAHICIPPHTPLQPPPALKIPHGYKWLPPDFPLVLGSQLLFVDPLPHPPRTDFPAGSPLPLPRYCWRGWRKRRCSRGKGRTRFLQAGMYM